LNVRPRTHRRRSIRLKNYDYTQAGGYFITICAHDWECIFGEIADGTMRKNQYGAIIQEEWLRTPKIRPEIMLDAFIVMPNHFHGVIIINEAVGATRRVAPTEEDEMDCSSIEHGRPRGPAQGSLGAIIGQLKSVAAKRINRFRGTPGAMVWQRNYYEHVIRNDKDLDEIREYIVNNPARWAEDENNRQRRPAGPPLRL
jgi:REP element-mobilizing transposase RayT